MAIIVLVKNKKSGGVVIKRYAKSLTLHNGKAEIDWLHSNGKVDRTAEIDTSMFTITARDTCVIDRAVEINHFEPRKATEEK